jgi:capsular exopolysaccharide synthesis family protein
MSRLREAFEKARLRQAAPQPAKAESGRGSDSSQLPQEWDFDLRPDDSDHATASTLVRFEAVEEGAPIDALEAGEEPGDLLDEQTPRDGSSVVVELPPVVAQPRPREEFWYTYQFGQKSMGKVVVGPGADATLVEQYRRLGAALHHHQLQSGARTLMVTSAVAAEGKTLTATNLALTLSHSYQRRVLLVDADLRRPSIHEILRLPNLTGLSDSLRHPEKTGLRFHTISPFLSALTAGRADSDPMAGLVSDTMNRILSEAAQQFDWVIVDTPPVALLPDANLLAAMIDTAVLVVSARATPYPLVRRAMDAIGQQRILGVVLNRMSKADMVAAYSYYGYGAYAYGVAKSSGRGLAFWRKRKPEERLRTDAKSEAAAG